MGATDCINPKDSDKPVQEVIVEMTDGGVDIQLRMHRQRQRDARGAGVLPQGLGRERDHRRRRARGRRSRTRPFQLVTGRVWRGSAFGGVKGRTQLPGMVEQAMRGEIELAPFVTHTLPLERINEAFDLMHEGKSIRTVDPLLRPAMTCNASNSTPVSAARRTCSRTLRSTLDCEMRFGVYLPPQAEQRSCPVLYWLCGLTCNEQNFITKAGAQRYAAEHGVILVAPDTSPRGPGVADADGYDLGVGAGFYVDATQAPWSTHYRMHDYVVARVAGADRSASSRRRRRARSAAIRWADTAR